MKYTNFFEWWKTVDDGRRLSSEKDIASDAWDACVEGMPEPASESSVRQLIDAYENFIKLLCGELEELAPLAMSHGWTSTRVEVGEKCRKRIKQLKDKVV